MLIAMSTQPGRSGPSSPSGPSSAGPEPPPLPPVLLEVWPVIAVGALGWLLATAAAFVVPALESWRPVTLAGLATTLLGTGIFVWQLAAARRGARGAQAGLETFLDPK
jgi:Protein of unknown function (DUF2530)